MSQQAARGSASALALLAAAQPQPDSDYINLHISRLPVDGGAPERLVRFAEFQESWVNRVCWSADGRQVAVTASGNVLSIADVATEKALGDVPFLVAPRSVYGLCAVGPSSFAVGAGLGIAMYDPRAGNCRQMLPTDTKAHEDTIVDLTASVDGQLLATCSLDKSIKLWDVRHAECLVNASLSSVPTSVEFDSTGTRLLVNCEAGIVRVLDLEAIAAYASPSIPQPAVERFTSVCCTGAANKWYSKRASWCCRESLIVAGSDSGHAFVWDAATGAEVGRVGRSATTSGDWVATLDEPVVCALPVHRPGAVLPDLIVASDQATSFWKSDRAPYRPSEPSGEDEAIRHESTGGSSSTSDAPAPSEHPAPWWCLNGQGACSSEPTIVDDWPLASSSVPDAVIDEEDDDNQWRAVGDDVEAWQCAFEIGYARIQAFSCMTCAEAAATERGVDVADDSVAAVLCSQCARLCHSGHRLVELGVKSNVRCDCGNSRFPARQSCNLRPDKPPSNVHNRYNHNYLDRWCYCDAPQGTVPMVQCILCEDWFHDACVDAAVDISTAPHVDMDYICEGCCDSHVSYLDDYPDDRDTTITPHDAERPGHQVGEGATAEPADAANDRPSIGLVVAHGRYVRRDISERLLPRDLVLWNSAPHRRVVHADPVEEALVRAAATQPGESGGAGAPVDSPQPPGAASPDHAPGSSGASRHAPPTRDEPVEATHGSSVASQPAPARREEPALAAGPPPIGGSEHAEGSVLTDDQIVALPEAEFKTEIKAMVMQGHGPRAQQLVMRRLVAAAAKNAEQARRRVITAQDMK